MFITQVALDNAVLFKLFLHAQASDDRLDKEQISKLFSIAISPKRVELALDNLVAREHISRWQHNGTCSIVGAGYQAVEEQLAQTTSFLRQYAEAGDEWLRKQTIDLGGIPAADRVVKRTDNQDAFAELDETLEIITRELETNNEIGSELGDDKDLIVAEVEASKTLTQQKSFRVARLISLLAPALRFLADKFSGAAIGDAAKRLMQLLIDLI